MEADHISALGTVIAAVIASASLLWAIYSWRKQRVHDELVAFRSDLASFRAHSEILRSAISDTVAFEIGGAAALHLQRFLGQCSGKEFKDILQKGDPQEIILGSLIAGFSNSKQHERQLQSTFSLRQLSGKYNERFPALNDFLVLVTRQFDRFVQPHAYVSAVNDQIQNHGLIERLVKEISDDSAPSLVIAKMSDDFSAMVATGNKVSVPVVSRIYEMLEIILPAYLLMSDAELEETSKEEAKRVRSRESLSAPTFSVAIAPSTDPFQHVLRGDDWTRLVSKRAEIKTLLENP